jgi:hypothetical protein
MQTNNQRPLALIEAEHCVMSIYGGESSRGLPEQHMQITLDNGS